MNYKVQSDKEEWMENIIKPAIAGGLSLLIGKYYFTDLGDYARVIGGYTLSKSTMFFGLGAIGEVLNDLINTNVLGSGRLLAATESMFLNPIVSGAVFVGLFYLANPASIAQVGGINLFGAGAIVNYATNFAHSSLVVPNLYKSARLM
jgi:hypothetical protein